MKYINLLTFGPSPVLVATCIVCCQKSDLLDEQSSIASVHKGVGAREPEAG